jgi:hypothetical protein
MKLLLVAAVALAGALIASAQVSVTTNRNDNARDGQNLNETILTPSNVNSTQFGKLFSQSVDGMVYAQPLYVPSVAISGLGTHNVVFVATEHDSVYAFDADNNTGINASPLWHSSFIDPAKGVTTVPNSDVTCEQIVPEIGITSTPVIDPATQTLFVLVTTKENGSYVQRLHALNITTGQEQADSPVVIQAQVKGSGGGSQNGIISFDTKVQGQRPGLLLVNGNIVIAWASYCDERVFHGWIMSYDETRLSQNGLINVTADGTDGGIWQSGTGIASDGKHIFVAVGNGTYDGPQGGKDFGDSIIKLSTNIKQQGSFDYFTPYNQAKLSETDTDVGSGGVLLLPDQGSGAPHQHLLVQVGKTGSIYLIDRDHMGGYNPKNNHQIVQDMENAIGGMWASPGWWNNNVYFGGEYDNLRQYTFNTTTGLLSSSAVYITTTYFNYPGPTPSISANGNNDAILWVLATDSYPKAPAVLHAYDATNVSTEFYNTDQNPSRDTAGLAVKFTVPTVVNGKVYVPAQSELDVYGLLGR